METKTTNQKPTVNLMICTPVHSEVKVDYVKSLIMLLQAAPIHGVNVSTPYFPKGSAIHQQRNWALAIFLKNPELTHLLFIDSDIAFPAQHVFKLLKHDKDFSGIAYRAKTDAHIGFNVHLKKPHERCPVTGMIKARYLNGGFTLIKRCVVEKMVAAYPHLKCLGFPPSSETAKELNNFYFNLFDWAVNEKQNIQSEDFTFCQRWADLGGEVWVDETLHLGHIGDKAYTGRLQDNLVDGEYCILKY
jgi:hypothetical protein